MLFLCIKGSRNNLTFLAFMLMGGGDPCRQKNVNFFIGREKLLRIFRIIFFFLNLMFSYEKKTYIFLIVC